MQFKGLIQGLCERLGLNFSDADLTESEFELNADEAQIRISKRADQLQMQTVLRSVPETDQAKQKLYKQLLTSCGAGALYYGGSLALDPETQQILLYQCFPLHALSILEFEQALDNFLTTVDHYNTPI